MDMTCERNLIRLCGTMAAPPEYSHTGRFERFYIFPLDVQRLSGACDSINIIVRQAQLEELAVQEKSKLRVTGELRSFNNRKGEGAKLVITVLARELELCDDEDENSVLLTGTLCKPPNLRTTPMGRDICDLMLAVNRRYGRSDYLPCICWGLKARDAAQWDVGTVITLTGRVQSRKYIKLIDGRPMEKTAFEVSVTDAAETQLL